VSITVGRAASDDVPATHGIETGFRTQAEGLGEMTRLTEKCMPPVRSHPESAPSTFVAPIDRKIFPASAPCFFEPAWQTAMT
jgi:hypothetical protein